MKNKSKKSQKASFFSRKKVLVYTSLVGVSLLSLASVVSCSSIAQTAVNNANKVSVNANPTADSFTSSKLLTLQQAAQQALNTSAGQTAWLQNEADQIVEQWFSTANKTTNPIIAQQYETAVKAANTTFSNAYNNLKNKYPTTYNYYVENNLYAPVGGTKQDYLNSLVYANLMNDFVSDVTYSYTDTQNANYDLTGGIDANLHFAPITLYNTKSDSSIILNTPSAISNVMNTSSYATNLTNDAANATFYNTTANWAGANRDNWSLSFFPNVLPSNNNYSLEAGIDNFLMFVFDEWVKETNPFLSDAAMLATQAQSQKATYGSSTYAPIYNPTYFGNALDSSAAGQKATFNQAFPYFSNKANQNFTSFINNLLNPNTNQNKQVVSWSSTDSVYSASPDATGGINLQPYTQAGNQSSYLMNTIGNNNEASQSLTSFVLPYLSAILNRYNVLMDNAGSASFNDISANGTSSSLGGLVYNAIPINDIVKNDLLSNFFYQYANGSTGQFVTNAVGKNSAQTIQIFNPVYSYFLYNGKPLTNATFSKFWNYNQANTTYEHDDSSIMSFNLLYNNSSKNNASFTLSPFVVTRDQYGAQIIAIDGYNRILKAEQDPTAIASPINVYPNPTNSMQAAIDAIAQDLLWRQYQVNENPNSSVTLSGTSGLGSYLKNFLSANEYALVILYAAQLMQNAQQTNNMFGSGFYNLFNDLTKNTNFVFFVNKNAHALAEATLNLVETMFAQRIYLVDQANQLTFKARFLTYISYFTQNSSSNSYQSNYLYAGTIAPFPFYTGLNNATSVQNWTEVANNANFTYPELSLALYQPGNFVVNNQNVFGFLASSQNGQATTVLSSTANSANVYDYSNVIGVTQQLDNYYNVRLNNDISSYLTALPNNNNATSWSGYNTATGKYCQDVLVQNAGLNLAIQAAISSQNLIYNLQNQVIAKHLNLNLSALSSPSLKNDFGLINSVFDQGLFANSSVNNGESFYSNNNQLSSLAVALLYEYFASQDVLDKTNNFIQFGYDTPIASTANNYLANQSNATAWITQNISSLTNQFATNVVQNNTLYDNNFGTNAKILNNYLTILQTINYLYDNGTWTNLQNDLYLQAKSSPLFLVWENGDNTTYNANGLNGYIFNSQNDNNNLNSANTTIGVKSNTNYDNLNMPYGSVGYVVPTASDVTSYGYGPFNYIPYGNLNGQMFNQFIDPNLANAATQFGSAGLAYNNITSFNTNLTNYYNIANVNVDGTIYPFTGFCGLVNSNNASTYGLSSLFGDGAANCIGGMGVLSNYSSFGVYNQNQTAKPGTLINAIETANNLSALIAISDQLQYANTSFPTLYQVYTSSATQSQLDQAFASKVYTSYQSLIKDGYTPGWFVNPFQGYVTAYTSSYQPNTSGFSSTADFYQIVTGGTNLEYNNPYTVYSTLSKSKLIESNTITDAATLVSDVQTARQISNNNLTENAYASQITLNQLNGWNFTKASTTGPWINLNITKDAFMKMVVQLAQTASLQTDALSWMFNKNNTNHVNKLTVYDIRIKNALGILWVNNVNYVNASSDGGNN